MNTLLVSRDTQIARMLQLALERYSVRMELCIGPHAAKEILATEHFDGAIVDCDDLEGGIDVMRGLRRSPANKNTVGIAVVHGQTTASSAFEMGAHFVLQKPLTMVNAVRCASAVVGMMTREKRRYFRCPLKLDVMVTFAKGEKQAAKACNLSEGGMAISLGQGAAVQSVQTVEFTLPGTHLPVEQRSEIAWQDENGNAGIKFLDPPKKLQQAIEGWIAQYAVKRADQG
jgi:DNA-binding response OmpR family regulator